MIPSVWKNLYWSAERQVLIPAKHLWCDFKCRPWAKNSSPNTKTKVNSVWCSQDLFLFLELTVNGKLTNNPADVAEALNFYFVDSVVTISQCFSPKYSEVYTVNTVEQALTLSAVSELDVTRTITSLKPSRAKDIFSMDVIMFKELSESLVNPITKMINLSVSQGMFPCAWKSSVIVPIFNSGDPHSASELQTY